ncbi:MAG TPA: ABC transporter permease [Planctomycetota bacterium]|nr:ABC transporter permease [Planctomycetota bacterium]
MKLARLITKNLRRRPMRTVFTLLGVASAMLLFVLVESLSAGLDRAMSGTQAARTLIVYRQNRYCPQTSFLPESYTERISKLPGVQSVLPVKVYLNNCRASLDLVAFQGAPVDAMLAARELEVVEGDVEIFRRERDSALVGRAFAARKHLRAGDAFRFGNINVKVAGVFASSEPVEEGVVMTHLEYLQRAGPVNRLGTVTQFEVRIDDATHAREISESIDALFANAQEPTDTRAKIQYLEGATRDLREILRFARWLGLGCVAVVLALVANTVLMSAQERVREFGVFRTLGFRERHIAFLVLGEAWILSLGGCALGLAGALAIVELSHVSIGSEGVSVGFVIVPLLVVRVVIVSLVAGTLAGVFPALRTARRPVVLALREA